MTKGFPTRASGPIPGDPFGRTYAELDHWYRQRGTNLRQECVRAKKEALLELARTDMKKPTAGATHAYERALGKALQNYTRERSDSYDATFTEKLRRLQPGWLDFAATKKAILLRMARSGAAKPTRAAWDPNERQLAHLLYSYTQSTSRSYAPDFRAEVWRLRPDWLSTHFHRESDRGYAHPTAMENKQTLVEMARSGHNRPRGQSRDGETARLARALNTYLNERRSAYDPSFSKLIRQLRADWFVQTTTSEKKTALLKLAKNGAPRPLPAAPKGSTQRTLAVALQRYTNANCKGFDGSFNRKIRRDCPNWFETTADARKRELINLAESGAERPSKSPLAGALSRYVREKSAIHDPVFEKKIRRLQPDWFTDSAKEKKALLLKMAKSDEPKPSITAKDNAERQLGHALGKYIRSSRSHDVAFALKIRQIRPDWIETRTAARKRHAAVNKLRLIELASNGAKRPLSQAEDLDERRLAATLYKYTTRKNAAYDPSFNAKLRRLRPDWFTNTAASRKTQVTAKKAKLLKLARKKSRRPSQEGTLGKILTSYTSPKSNTYDPVFKAEIRRLCPAWFCHSDKLCTAAAGRL